MVLNTALNPMLPPTPVGPPTPMTAGTYVPFFFFFFFSFFFLIFASGLKCLYPIVNNSKPSGFNISIARLIQ
jgi:hypothetical protein